MRIQGVDLNYRVSRMSVPHAGPTASAANFGAESWKQWYDLGQAGLKASNEIIRYDQMRRREQDETAIKTAVNEAHRRYNDQKQIIYDQYKGVESYKVPEEIGKLHNQLRDSIGETMQNGWQREGFQRAMDSFDTQTQERAVEYRDKQMAVARIQASDARLAIQSEDFANIAAEMNTGGWSDDIYARMRGILEAADTEIAVANRGMPPEALAKKRTDAMRTFWMQAINSMDNKVALDCLEKNALGVVDVLGKGAAKKLIDKLKEEKKIDGTYEFARALFDENVSDVEAMDRIYTQYEDKKTADATYALYSKLKGAKERDEQAANVDWYKQVRGMLIEADYNMSKLEEMYPEEMRTLKRDDPETWQKLVDESRKYDLAKATKTDGMYSTELKMMLDSMTPEEHLAWQSNPDNYALMYRQLGREPALLKEYERRANLAKNNQNAAAKAASGTGGSTSGGRADAYSEKEAITAFQNSFGKIYKKKGLLWDSEEKFNEKNAQHLARQDVFSFVFKNRVAEEVARRNGQSLSREDGQKIAYGVLSDMENGIVDGDKTIYTMFTEMYAQEHDETLGIKDTVIDASGLESEAAALHRDGNAVILRNYGDARLRTSRFTNLNNVPAGVAKLGGTRVEIALDGFAIEDSKNGEQYIPAGAHISSGSTPSGQYIYAATDADGNVIATWKDDARVTRTDLSKERLDPHGGKDPEMPQELSWLQQNTGDIIVWDRKQRNWVQYDVNGGPKARYDRTAQMLPGSGEWATMNAKRKAGLANSLAVQKDTWATQDERAVAAQNAALLNSSNGQQLYRAEKVRNVRQNPAPLADNIGYDKRASDPQWIEKQREILSQPKWKARPELKTDNMRRKEQSGQYTFLWDGKRWVEARYKFNIKRPDLYAIYGLETRR